MSDLQTETPEFQDKGLFYLLTWPKLHLAARVEHIAEHSNVVKAEVLFQSGGPGGNHLRRTSLNLLSDRSKGDIARFFGPKRPDVDWDVVVEQLSELSIRAYRQGEPFEEVGSLPVSPLTYLIDPLLPENKTSLIFGLGGMGKSTLACLLGIKAELGLAGPGPGLGTKKTRTLYLDWETEADEINSTLSRLKAGLCLDSPVTFRYRRCFRPLADSIESIANEVVAQSIGFVIVDSAILAIGDDVNPAHTVARLYNALRSLSVTCLILSHTSKAQDGEKSAYGSVFFENSARSEWFLRASRNDSSLHLGLIHKKVNRSALKPPIGLCFEFDGDDGPICVSSEDVQDVPQLAGNLTGPERVLQALSDAEGPLYRSTIKQITGLQDSTLGSILSRLADKGQIETPGAGLWKLR